MKNLILLTVLAISSLTFAYENGVYTNQEGDQLTILQNFISLESSRQVGGPGGFSDQEMLAYPTLCRYQVIAQIKRKITDLVTGDELLQYQVKKTFLISALEEKERGGCEMFIKTMNSHAENSELVYELNLSQYSLEK